MSGRHYERSGEALSRLPQLDLGELRALWRRLYKTEALSPGSEDPGSSSAIELTAGSDLYRR